MKVKHEVIKAYPVPALRVVVNNGTSSENDTAAPAGDQPKSHVPKKTSRTEKTKKNNSIPEFYQHIIKPKEYDFF